jgi:hypothetical protein
MSKHIFLFRLPNTWMLAVATWLRLAASPLAVGEAKAIKASTLGQNSILFVPYSAVLLAWSPRCAPTGLEERALSR